MRRALLLPLALALVLGGCNLRTTGTDPDGYDLTAAFVDVRNLVVGHAVRVSDVQIGTVTGIELNDDFTAAVTMTLDEGTEVPADTLAVIAKTSLLGENFVALQYPDDGGPPLGDGDVIQRTAVLPELEQVSQQAIDVLGAVLSADIDILVEETVAAIGGRGEQLQVLVGDIGDVTSTYAGRSSEIGTALDGFAQLGGDLAAGSSAIDGLIVELDRATAAVGAQRTRIIVTLEEVTAMATTLNDEVLVPHSDQLGRALEQLDPVVATLASETDRLAALLDALLLFSTNVQQAVVDDSAQVYGFVTRDPGPSDDLGDLLDPGGGDDPDDPQPVPTEPPDDPLPTEPPDDGGGGLPIDPTDPLP